MRINLSSTISNAGVYVQVQGEVKRRGEAMEALRTELDTAQQERHAKVGLQ